MAKENIPQVGRVAIGSDSTEVAVVIPCDPKDFGEFIGSLLGKSQEIEKSIYGKFFIEKDNIEDIFHLINQRVSQQNSGVLVSFTITIYYDDDSNVRLNSIDEFLRYAEVKPRLSLGFNMTWVYLIIFSGNKVPEKQEIDLGFSSDHRRRRRRTALDVEIYSALDGPGELEGRFKLRVRHTVRSWGVDIESLITGHIGTLRQSPVRGLRGYLRRNRSLAMWIAGCTYSAFILSCLIFGMIRYSQYKVASFSASVSNISETDRSDKVVDILASYIFSGETQYLSAFTIVFSILAAISVPIILERFSEAITGSGDRSVLLLTKQARDRYDYIRSLDDGFWKQLTLTAVLGVLCGVIANYVFLLLPKFSELLQ